LGDEASIARLDMTAYTHLSKAVADFKQLGYRLVIWDAFRTAAVQKELRAIDTDSRYVLEHSQHSVGLALDVTLADKAGKLLDMGTDHDEFSDLAHDGAAGLTELQESNRHTLKTTMSRNGFTVWPYEWWHFDYTGAERSPKRFD
jgi:D-alanyl-D-alanine dipeptidase